MRIQAAVFLLIIILSLISDSYQCQEGFNSANCSCNELSSRNYELLCPQNQYPHNSYVLMANIKPNEEVNMQCTVAKNPSDLTYVSGLSVGPVKRFNIKLCPLPDMSFHELLLSMGIPRIEHMQIQSAGNFNVLKKKHLEKLYDVTKLDLSSSGLTALPEDVFDDMSNLTWLHLNNNNNLNLPKGIFRQLPKLEVLDIGNNNLTQLETGIFRNLTRLRLLNLWGNRLTNLTRAIFSDTPNIESLDLHGNTLVTIRPDLFIDLGKLRTINLFGNEFSSLPQGLFYGNSLLERFLLFNNRKSLRTLPPGLLSNLTNLKEIRLNNCNLSSLPKDLTWDSPAVIDVQLNGNLLTELPAELFRDNKELLNIDISYNKLTDFPVKIFSENGKLKKIKAHHNQLTHISKFLLSNLIELEELDFSFNNLIEIHNEALLTNTNLRSADLSHNFLSLYSSNDFVSDDLFGRKSQFRYCVQLKQLHLANNSITEMFHDWLQLSHLTTLDLKHNKLTALQANDLHFRSGFPVEVDLSYNNISLIDLQQIEVIAVAQYIGKAVSRPKYNTHAKQGAQIQMSGNPFQCDCRNYHLKKYLEGGLAPEVNSLIEIQPDGLQCAGPKQLEGMLLSDVSSKRLVCSLDEIMDTNSAIKICPSNCTCFYRPEDKALIINCKNKNIAILPDNFLSGTLELYTNSYKNVNHTELFLGNNLLTSLPKELDEGFKYVTTLSLVSNNFTDIDVSNLSPNITVLELDNNNIKYLNSNAIDFFKNSQQLLRISLHKNPWMCDCDSRTRDLLNFIQNNFEKIDKLNKITCVGGKKMSKLTINDVCPYSTVTMKVVSATISILGIIMGLVTALYYRYNQEIKVWLYAHQIFLWFVTEEELDRDKLYDAFISYSHQDEDFVIKHLLPGLENGTPKFKLCLHFRDWIVGDYIPNQIARSVEDSRRTIVVLSPNFLESVWGKMEFRTAHSQALTEGRARVIVILYGDIGPTENLDPELKAYVSMNTYVKWGDPWFWDKLRFALPHPPKLSRGIPLFQRNLVQQQNRPTLKIDKDDLIKGTDPNATPPATTTPPANSFINQTLTLIPNGEVKPIEISKH